MRLFSMIIAATRKFKIGAALGFCLVVVGLTDAILLAGAAFKSHRRRLPSALGKSAGITATRKGGKSRSVSCPDGPRKEQQADS
jgi:hypothetical protein